MLKGKRIVLAITGGIAAYKAPILLRELLGRGADVRVVMTANAERFVTATTLQTLSHYPVHCDLFARDPAFAVLHVGLAEWADVVLLAPATANVLAKAAHGLADDLLTTLLLSTRAAVIAAPAMEENMLLHEAVVANSAVLKGRGWQWIDPVEGELASGASGAGRMAEPEDIAECVEAIFTPCDLVGRRLLVTAGPTVEDLDPVRFISNRSSGKMGYALAQRAQERGATVFLVSGPTQLAAPAEVERIEVRSALEMQREVERIFAEVDGAILAAAVADYRVAEVAAHKIKRGDGARTVELVENPDIAAGLGARKEGRTLVVFAMETEHGVERAREKLVRKGGDLIVLNNLHDEGAGFAVDTNIVSLIDARGQVNSLPKMSKLAVADRILDWVRDEGV
ncbi:MAG: phosphopantothenoylcysteine decarboxylase/phosphopantothenate--cysteine ligase [Candidatus Latescibacterota bacterium]|jgi:phosphopantothenoylcysteine decarboxylase/phosphopantothenate--cysteine ligase